MPHLEFEVYCAKCGAGLCAKTKVDGTAVNVEPCEKCLADTNQDGYNEGYDKAREEFDHD